MMSRNRLGHVLIGVLFSCGCELSHRPFAGAIVEMTLTSVPASAPGTHLELWARNPYNDTVRVSGIFDYTDSNNRTTRLFPYGFAVRPAITMDDPCMIDRAGHLLVTASAYRDTAVQGISQSAEEQAEQVRARIGQLTSLSSCDGSGLDPS